MDGDGGIEELEMGMETELEMGMETELFVDAEVEREEMDDLLLDLFFQNKLERPDCFLTFLTTTVPSLLRK